MADEVESYEPIVNCWATTTDNPHDCFTDFDAWYNYDESAGYHTCSQIARHAIISSSVSFVDEALEVERAVDAVVDLNLAGNYIKVYSND